MITHASSTETLFNAQSFDELSSNELCKLAEKLEQCEKIIEEQRKEIEYLKTRVVTKSSLFKRIYDDEELMGYITEVNALRAEQGLDKYAGIFLCALYEIPIMLVFYKKLKILGAVNRNEVNVRSMCEENFYGKTIMKQALITLELYDSTIHITRGRLSGYPQQGDFQIIVRNTARKEIKINIYEVNYTTKSKQNVRNIHVIESKQDGRKILSTKYYETLQAICNKKGGFTFTNSAFHGYNIEVQYWFISNEPDDNAFYETENGVKYISYKNLTMQFVDDDNINLDREIKNPEENPVVPEKIVSEICIDSTYDEAYMDEFVSNFMNAVSS